MSRRDTVNSNDEGFWSRGGDGGGWNPSGDPFEKKDGPMATKLKEKLGRGGKTGRDVKTLLHGGKTLEELFAEVDTDGGGTIGRDELRLLMIKLGRQVSGSELDRIMRFIDEDRSGEIELNEFREWWRMETDPENKNPTTKPAPADAAEAVRQRFPKRRPSDQKGGSARLATRKGMKLKLSAAEKLERQTTQIGKIVRDAIASNRSLGGKAMKNIEGVFKAIDKDGSGDLDHKEFETAMSRLGLGLTPDQIKQCIEVLDKDGDGEVSLDEFMALVNKPVKKAVRAINAVNAFKGARKPELRKWPRLRFAPVSAA